MTFSCSPRTQRLTLSASVVCLLAVASAASAQDCCEQPRWIFDRSTFSHDPETGARVAQYEPIAPVEDLPDPRLVTSGYVRSRTNLRGRDGNIDSYYQVQSYGNGRGGLDAEWERFNDAWQQSFLTGSYFDESRYDYRRPRYRRRYEPRHGYGPWHQPYFPHHQPYGPHDYTSPGPGPSGAGGHPPGE